ncbi:MAG: helix-turn-helix domain-containing protein [Pseudonocardia sp.]|nr:helix-turn-helix domain-containing protein [Pseudonocardia sp.]
MADVRSVAQPFRRSPGLIAPHGEERLQVGPQPIARACHLSLRSLHRLLADQPRSLSRWIRHRRLERARTELVSVPDKPVVVAARFCFSDPTVFARVPGRVRLQPARLPPRCRGPGTGSTRPVVARGTAHDQGTSWRCDVGEGRWGSSVIAVTPDGRTRVLRARSGGNASSQGC